MDISTVFRLVFGFGSVYIGYTMDGGDVGALMMLSAIIIVLGGSIGGLFMSYGIRNIVKLPKLMLETFLLPKSTINATIEYLVLLATKARQGGLLNLEKRSTPKPQEAFASFHQARRPDGGRRHGYRQDPEHSGKRYLHL
jgi:chemotaxis protein MotA